MPDYKKEIRKEIFRLNDTVTDEELFSCDSFLRYLQGAVDAALKTTGRDVKLMHVPPERNDVAYTDGFNIYIDPMSVLVKASTGREERYLAVLGEIVHEAGHILYTDFIVQRQHINTLLTGNWFPEPPCPVATDITERMHRSPSFRSLFLSTLASFRNIAEDIYVENRLEHRFSGLFIEGLRTITENIKATSPCLDEILSRDGGNVLLALTGGYLQMARFGEAKYSVESNEVKRILNTLQEMKEDTELLRYEADAVNRCRLVNAICWRAVPYISELCDKHDSKDAERSAIKLSCNYGPMIPEGRTSPAADCSESAEFIPVPDSGIARKKYIEETASRHVENSHINELTREAEEIFSSLEKKNDIYLREKPGSKDTHIMIYRKCNHLENNDIRIHRKAAVGVETISLYNQYFDCVSSLSNRTVRALNNAFSLRKAEGKEKGLVVGKHISPSLYSRNDGKIYTKNMLPDGKPDLCICILVDESGSMMLDNREKIAAKTAVMLENVFRRTLDEGSYCIVGHTADFEGRDRSLDLFVYCDFDKTDQMDRYRLAEIHARDQNRDGDAVKYCCEKLLRRPEKTKLLIVISDGIPLASGYSGPPAEEELMYTVSHYRKAGIGIIAAALSTKDINEQLGRLYGSRWTIDCSQHDLLPSNLARLIKNVSVLSLQS